MADRVTDPSQEELTCKCAEQDEKKIFYTANELMKTVFPPVAFTVDGLITAGLTIVASPPKFGKSWMMLQMAMAVSQGQPFLGHRTKQGDVLYLALEDTPSRLKSRLEMQNAGSEAPNNLGFLTECPDMDHSFLDYLQKYIDKYPNTKLVIVDTLQKIRGVSYGRDGAYSTDYRELSLLKAFADENRISFVLVHHLRKMEDSSDPFNMILGTNGIMGVADTAVMLMRKSRNDKETRMLVTGRDIESLDILVTFDPSSGLWTNRGNSDDYPSEDYMSSPLVATIKSIVESNNGVWTGTVSELMEAGAKIAPARLPLTPQGVSRGIAQLEEQLYKYDKIEHRRASNGSGGGKHTFRKASGKDEN